MESKLPSEVIRLLNNHFVRTRVSPTILGCRVREAYSSPRIDLPNEISQNIISQLSRMRKSARFKRLITHDYGREYIFKRKRFN